LPDFSWYKREFYAKLLTSKLSNNYGIYQIAVKFSNGHQIGIPTTSFLRPSKIYTNWEFWHENIPSGNPAADHLETAVNILKLIPTQVSAVGYTP
jgi:hypothetical protein